MSFDESEHRRKTERAQVAVDHAYDEFKKKSPESTPRGIQRLKLQLGKHTSRVFRTTPVMGKKRERAVAISRSASPERAQVEQFPQPDFSADARPAKSLLPKDTLDWLSDKTAAEITKELEAHHEEMSAAELAAAEAKLAELKAPAAKEEAEGSVIMVPAEETVTTEPSVSAEPARRPLGRQTIYRKQKPLYQAVEQSDTLADWRREWRQALGWGTSARARYISPLLRTVI